MSFDQDITQLDSIHDDIHLPSGMEIGSLSTAIGGDDGEPVQDDTTTLDDRRSLAPSHSSRPVMPPTPVYRALEMGFRPSKSQGAPSLSDGVRGIRVDVEKATVTM